MMTEHKNMELMQTLDDAWNAHDWGTFDKRHKPDVVVRWSAQPPTYGRRDHRGEGVQMFKTFPDNKVHNRPYGVFLAIVPHLFPVSSCGGRGQRPTAASRTRWRLRLLRMVRERASAGRPQRQAIPVLR